MHAVHPALAEKIDKSATSDNSSEPIQAGDISLPVDQITPGLEIKVTNPLGRGVCRERTGNVHNTASRPGLVEKIELYHSKLVKHPLSCFERNTYTHGLMNTTLPSLLRKERIDEQPGIDNPQQGLSSLLVVTKQAPIEYRSERV